MRKFTPVLIIFSMLFVAGCVTNGNGNSMFNKQGVGTLLGAGLGAWGGSQFGSGNTKLAAVAIGTLAGAYFGREIGASLDKADQLAAQQTAQVALERNPVGQTSTWRNPNRGTSGSVTPTYTYQKPSGQYCREYQTEITIGGKLERGYGTACRRADGAWEVAARDTNPIINYPPPPRY